MHLREICCHVYFIVFLVKPYLLHIEIHTHMYVYIMLHFCMTNVLEIIYLCNMHFYKKPFTFDSSNTGQTSRNRQGKNTDILLTHKNAWTVLLVVL